MSAASKLEKWTVEKNGNDYFIRVPGRIGKFVKRNSRMTIRVETNEGPREFKASFSPGRRNRSSLRLEDLIGHIRNSKKGGLVEFGPPVGKETR